MRVRIALVLVLLTALTGSVAATSGAAAAPLDGLHGAGWIVADEAHGQVFVTGSPTSANTQVAVLGLDGSRTGTITQQGAAGMTVAGGTLWVAGCNTKQIVGYDLTTLAVTDTITTSRTLRFPCDLDAVAGKFWFDEPPTDIGSPDAQPASVTIAAPHTEASFAGTADPMFTTDPARATRLLMTSMNGSPNTFDLWDIRAVPPSPVASAPGLGTGLGNGSSAITPDGTLVWVLHNGGLAAYKLARIANQRIVDRRTNRGSAEALAVTADGGHIAAGVLVSSHPGIDVFGAAHSPVHSETFDETGADVVGLAFTHDASRLFVVDQPSDGAGTPYLHVIESPTVPASHVALNALGTVTAGGHVAVSGRLSLEDGAAVEGDHVAVTATRPDATQVVVGSAAVNAAGGFAIDSGELELAGTWTFTATYPGDAGHGASSASGTLTVTPFPTSLSVTTSAAQIVAGQTSHGDRPPGRCLRWQCDGLQDGGRGQVPGRHARDERRR